MNTLHPSLREDMVDGRNAWRTKKKKMGPLSIIIDIEGPKRKRERENKGRKRSRKLEASRAEPCLASRRGTAPAGLARRLIPKIALEMQDDEGCGN